MSEFITSTTGLMAELFSFTVVCLLEVGL